jgi:hypothetical protein
MKKPHLTVAPVPNPRQPNNLMTTLLGRRQVREERQEKIASLSKAVKSNAYRIDCRKLADCLIAGLLLGLLR